jgi:hypothetical protein
MCEQYVSVVVDANLKSVAAVKPKLSEAMERICHMDPDATTVLFTGLASALECEVIKFTSNRDRLAYGLVAVDCSRAGTEASVSS